MVCLKFTLRLGTLRHLFLVRRIESVNDILNRINDTAGKKRQSLTNGLGGFPCTFKKSGRCV